MKKFVFLILLVIMATLIIAPYSHAGKVKKAVTGTINTIKSRGQTSTTTTTASTAVRG